MTFAALRRAPPLLTVGLVAVMGMLHGGCSDDDDDDVFIGPANTGTMEVAMTDAPPDLEGLRTFILNIQRIEAIGGVTTGSTSTVTLFDAGNANGPEVDLAQLRGGQTEVIATTRVPAGTYDRVRLVFSRGQVDFQPAGGVSQRTFSTENGLLTFSGGATPQQVEVDLPGDGVQVTPGDTTRLLIDVDVAESLEAVGDPENPEAIVVTPTARARDLADTGAVAGVVRAGQNTSATTDDTPIENAQVTLLASDGTTVVARTKTDASGVFVLEGIPAGTYTLSTTAPDVATPTTTSVQVSGDRVTSDVVIPTATSTTN